MHQEVVEGIVKAVWAIVKSVTKGIWLRNDNDIRWKAGQFGGGALVERPPTIRVHGAVSGGEGGEVTLYGAFNRDVGRNAAFDRVPFGLGYGVIGEENGGLNPVGREVARLGAHRGIGIRYALLSGIWNEKWGKWGQPSTGNACVEKETNAAVQILIEGALVIGPKPNSAERVVVPIPCNERIIISTYC